MGGRFVLAQDSAATDALGADNEIVEVAFLCDRRSPIPVILNEHGVEAVVAVVADPVEICAFRLQLVINPELKYTVGYI